MTNDRIFNSNTHKIQITFGPNYLQNNLLDFHDSNDVCMHTLIDSFDMSDSESGGLIHFYLKNLDNIQLNFAGDSGNTIDRYFLTNKLIAIKCAVESILKKLHAKDLLRKATVNYSGSDNHEDSFPLPIQIQPGYRAGFQNETIRQCMAIIKNKHLIFSLNELNYQDRIEIKACLKELFTEKELAHSTMARNDNAPARRRA